MNYYYVNDQNQPIGPQTEEQMRRLFRQGTLAEDSLVIVEGAAEWRPFAEVFPPTKADNPGIDSFDITAVEPPASPQENDESESYQYWAFISYSSKDKGWGRWLHNAIETYGIPADFAGRHQTPMGHLAPKRFHPLFRDRDELPASSDLGAVIREALTASRYLIVICSPHAARSVWVNTEIENFISLGRRDQIFAVIVGGEPNAGDSRECFPPALRQFEPIAADARSVGDGKTNAKLKLLSGMLGVSFDSLKQRDARRRARRFTMAAAVCLMMIAVIVSLVKVTSIEREKGEHRRYGADMLKIQNAWDEGDMPRVVELLEAQRPQSGDADNRGWEWYYWLKRTHGEVFTLANSAGQDIDRVRFSPDGKEIATAGVAVTLWSATTGKPLFSLGDFTESTGGAGLSCTLGFSPDGKLLAVEDEGATKIVVWNLASRKKLYVVKGESCCFSPDGLWLAIVAIAHETEVPLIFDAKTGKELFALKQKARSEDGWDDEPEGSMICFSPDSQRLAIADSEEVSIWKVSKPERLLTIGFGRRSQGSVTNGVNDICYSPDGQRLAAACANGTAIVWDANTGKELLTCKGHEGPVNCVCYSPDGQLLATGSKDKTVRVWNANSGEEIYTPRVQADEIAQVCFSPNGRLLASCDGTLVRVWSASTNNLVSMVAGETPVVANSKGSSSKWIVRSGAICDAKSGKTIRPLQGWDSYFQSDANVCFSPDGKRLAAKGQVWDMTTGNKLFQFTADISCFSPDGKRIASTTKYGTKIYDAETGQEFLTLKGNKVPASGIGFSQDGKQLYVSYNDGKTEKWDAATSDND